VLIDPSNEVSRHPEIKCALFSTDKKINVKHIRPVLLLDSGFAPSVPLRGPRWRAPE